MTKVSVVKIDYYDTQTVEQAMQELFDHRWSQFVLPRDRVLVELNMLERVEKGSFSNYPSIGSH
jgi:hypothetical protein